MIALVRSLNRCGDRVGGDVAGARVDVGEHRDRALVEDRRQRAHVGDRGGDDLVARLGVEGRDAAWMAAVPEEQASRGGRRASSANSCCEVVDHPTLGGRERSALEDLSKKSQFFVAETSARGVLV